MSRNDEFSKGHDPLTDDEKATLDFEAQHFSHAGDKEEAIVRTFGHSATRHYMRVNSIIDKPAAVEYNPVMVNRLRRQREDRQGQRSATRMGFGHLLK